MLARSIRLRNPYVDPISLIQVDLLRRKRAGDDSDAINRALSATINGISAGLRKPGETDSDNPDGLIWGAGLKAVTPEPMQDEPASAEGCLKSTKDG